MDLETIRNLRGEIDPKAVLALVDKYELMERLAKESEARLARIIEFVERNR